MPALLRMGMFAVVIGGGGCDSTVGDEGSTTAGTADRCAGSPDPVVTLGQGVGGNFSAYADGDEVTLTAAPQGGFGITSLIRTEGLLAGSGAYVDLTLDLELGGSNEGTFFIPQLTLLCSGEDIGGIISGVMAGFDPDKYQTNDDLLALDGQVVEIVVIVTDSEGNTGTARQPVTVRVGG